MRGLSVQKSQAAAMMSSTFPFEGKHSQDNHTTQHTQAHRDDKDDLKATMLLLLLLLLVLCPAARAFSMPSPPPPTPPSTSSLFVFGLGYVGSRLAQEIVAVPEWEVGGTLSSLSSSSPFSFSVRVWEYDARPATPKLLDAAGLEALRQATHVLVTIPPVDGKDSVVNLYGSDLVKYCPRLRWVGYLSSTSVYGDRGGDWVNEKDAVQPVTSKGVLRVEAEAAWTDLVWQIPSHRPHLRVFRLAGIYGPGRNALETTRRGLRGAQGGVETSRLDGDRWVSRIHVEDIVRVLRCSMEEGDGKDGVVEIYNVADDRPASRIEVFSFAAGLLGKEGAAGLASEQPAASSLSPSPTSRRARPPESKRVANDKMKRLLLGGSSASSALRYPTYEEGLRQIWKDIVNDKD